MQLLVCVCVWERKSLANPNESSSNANYLIGYNRFFDRRLTEVKRKKKTKKDSSLLTDHFVKTDFGSCGSFIESEKQSRGYTVIENKKSKKIL